MSAHANINGKKKMASIFANSGGRKKKIASIWGNKDGKPVLVWSSGPSFVQIAVTVMPNQMSYLENESFDTTGMVVMGTDKKGNTYEITEYMCTKQGNIVTISYGKLNTTIEITIVNLNDFEYTDNGNGTYTLTGWKGTLNGETSTKLVIPDSKAVVLV